VAHSLLLHTPPKEAGTAAVAQRRQGLPPTQKNALPITAGITNGGEGAQRCRDLPSFFRASE